MISTEKTTSNAKFSYYKAEPHKVSTPFYGDDGVEYFMAGQFVVAGCYAEIDGPRQVYLDRPDILPASLDGRRALYRRLERPWMNLANQSSVGN